MNHPIDYTQPRKSRKLPKHFSPVAFAFFMSSIMALLMCTVIVAVSGGVTGDFAWRVGKAYMLAMPVAFTTLTSEATTAAEARRKACGRVRQLSEKPDSRSLRIAHASSKANTMAQPV